MTTYSERLDKLAMSLSAVCLLHCLLAPVLLTLVPLISLSAYAEELIFHQLLLWVIIPTSLVALFLGCKKHRSALIVITGLLGMGILLAVATLGHDIVRPNEEKWLTSLGGVVLAISHYMNYRTCQNIRCRSSHCESEHHH
ncbi:MAG TPA: MerC domain-containing protein [Gammaproteobacteria bacterium]|jgi:hypothetical protein|nr:MerC domain-containing protein [Gammaproteobacteria bacterium]